MSIVIVFFSYISLTQAETIRVFTWEGYVEPHEVSAVNTLLKEKGYSEYTVEVIKPWAEGPEHMFKVLGAGKADISFLTLNYIKMQSDKIAKLLQPINTSSPRLSNFSKLSPSLTAIPMAMRNDKPLYLPWGGGAYGIWANMDKLKTSDLPSSVKDLWDKKWKGKLALSSGQVQPNIAIAALAMNKAPFYINDMAADRAALAKESDSNSQIQLKVNSLYSQVGQFWPGGPDFSDSKVVLVASYGIAASAVNASGGNWQLISFKEGNTVWLDTINFHKDMKGRKLEAAEIFANYFIGKAVQERVVNGLGMVAASSLVDKNPLIDTNPNFFSVDMFWPPYKKAADNVMLLVSERAMKK
ncbi:spermidine/putrescine ABC transporter substrate-binding protein [Gammaproteobacteria bacterium 42_54_T18]|nr:spermidine/putrescine ABC transporter substrate-binding protein [Gammaproteobacteria bacterium 42_54_T18]